MMLTCTQCGHAHHSADTLIVNVDGYWHLVCLGCWRRSNES